MTRLIDGLLIEAINLDTQHKTPLHRQIYEQVRQMVLAGTLKKGRLFPSSRTFAKSLGVSRFTVVSAIDQLVAEGYLTTKLGSGTFVEGLPSIEFGDASSLTTSGDKTLLTASPITLSKRAQQLCWEPSLVSNLGPQFLQMSAPDHRLFPYKTWANLTKHAFSQLDTELASYKISDNSSLLQQQIAEQVAISRGIKCTPGNVVITLGAHHAVNLLGELLVNPGDTVAIEDPCMAAVRSIFNSLNCQLISLPVDQQGADPSQINNAQPKLTFVTAAKQQPLIIAMSAKRKLQLLNWAAKCKTIIIEDDQGSEFRYQGHPIAPLKAMDSADQVVYLGSFSMSLLQSLRIGYMIMPLKLAEPCRRLMQIRYRSMPLVSEQIMGLFIKEGHYNRHLHKARRIYATRQSLLLEILNQQFQAYFEPPVYGAGFHIICYFKDQTIDEHALIIECDKQGLGIEQLRYYFQDKSLAKKALLLGFAASNETEIKQGTALLLDILQSHAF